MAGKGHVSVLPMRPYGEVASLDQMGRCHATDDLEEEEGRGGQEACFLHEVVGDDER